MPATAPIIRSPTGAGRRPGTGLEHMPGLDGLRGLAVAAVVTYHFEPTILPGGFIGVDVFFVLSGFLITSLLLRERMVRGTIDFSRFFVRRMRRLMPALLALLLALAVYAAVWADPVELSRLRRHGLAMLGYVSNWIFIADGTTYTDIVVGASPLRHVWSLAIEEQLYVVLALGVVGTSLFGPADEQRKRFGMLAGALAVISAAWMAWLSSGGAPTERTYFGTDTRAHSMLVGAVIGALLVGRPASDRWLVRVGGWAGLVVLAAVALVGAEDARWLHQGGFLVVALAAGAVVVGCASNPLMRSIFSVRPLRALGNLSYGVYLWHWPVLVIFDRQRTGIDGLALTMLRIVISLAVAAASYVLVEQPIRSGALGRRWGRRAGIPAAISVVSVALVAVVLIRSTMVPALVVTTDAGAARAGGVPASDLAAATATTSPPTTNTTTRTNTTTTTTTTTNTVEIAADDREERAEAAADIDIPAATTTELLEPVRVVVIGDSVLHTIIGGEVLPTGLQFTPWSADQTSFDPEAVEVVSLAKPACSFLPGEIAILDPNGSYTHASLAAFCGEWRAEFRSALDSVDLVAVHLSNDLEDRWIDGDLFRFGTTAYFGLLGEFLEGMYVDAAAAGVPMLLIASAPREDPFWREDLGEREALVAEFYEQWASTHPAVSTVDLGLLVCPDGVCQQEIDGVDWRWDGRHYTQVGARAVARWLTPVIRGAATPNS